MLADRECTINWSPPTRHLRKTTLIRLVIWGKQVFKCIILKRVLHMCIKICHWYSLKRNKKDRKLISCTEEHFISMFHSVSMQIISTTCCFLTTDRPQWWFLVFKDQKRSETSSVRLKVADWSTSRLVFSALPQAAGFTVRKLNMRRRPGSVRVASDPMALFASESGFVCVRVSGVLRFYSLCALSSGVDFLALRWKSRPSGRAGNPSGHGGQRRGEIRRTRNEDVPHQSCGVTESLNAS